MAQKMMLMDSCGVEDGEGDLVKRIEAARETLGAAGESYDYDSSMDHLHPLETLQEVRARAVADYVRRMERAARQKVTDEITAKEAEAARIEKEARQAAKWDEIPLSLDMNKVYHSIVVAALVDTPLPDLLRGSLQRYLEESETAAVSPFKIPGRDPQRGAPQVFAVDVPRAVLNGLRELMVATQPEGMELATFLRLVFEAYVDGESSRLQREDKERFDFTYRQYIHLRKVNPERLREIFKKTGIIAAPVGAL